MMPKFLYRGDSDKYNKRSLKSKHNTGLHTNFLNGGDERIVYAHPIEVLANRHVDLSWDKTPFLSFSSNPKVAYRYGIHCTLDRVDEELAEYLDYYNDDEKWDFAMLEIDTSRLNINNLSVGVYEGFFKPNLRAFWKDTGLYRIIIIDVKTVLSNAKDGNDYSSAIQKATDDEEWLIFPATLMQLNPNGYHGYSAILDDGCISLITKYAKNISIDGSFI